MRHPSSAPDPFRFGEYPGYPAGGNHNTDGKARSGPHEKVGVFVCAGQSNACNMGPTGFTPSTWVDNLNIYDGAIYRAADPLLGCHNVPPSYGPGNVFTRMADKLIADRKYSRVILVPVGIGGTRVGEWVTYPGLNQRLVVAGRRCEAQGFKVTAFLWMQGESDTLAGTAQASYAASLASLIAVPRAAGFIQPWLVGLCSYLTGSSSAAVRAAQAAAVNGTDIFAGADTDTLTAASRQVDNVHLNDAGVLAAGNLWASAIEAAL